MMSIRQLPAPRPVHLRQRWPRRAMTLVELLVVVAIMVVLLGVAVPMMKMPLQESRIREASRQVNALFAQAQARARELGRPVAVWIERSAGDPNMATELYLAETPLPYSGDVLGARAVVYPYLVSPPASWSVPPYLGLASTPTLVPKWRIQFDPSSVSVNAPSSTALIHDTDRFRIRFDYKGPFYDATRSGGEYELVFDGDPIENVNKSILWQPPRGFWRPGGNNVWGAPGSDNIALEPAAPLGPIDNDDAEAGWGYTTSGATDDLPTGLPYQVHLSPRRSSAPPLQLPTGIALDLAGSGIGMDVPLSLPASGSIGGIEFGGTWNGTAVIPPNNPVLIVVGPDGSVQWIQSGGAIAKATNSVHLLVGRLAVSDAAAAAVNPLPWSTGDTTSFSYAGNLADPSAIWVSIGCQTGAVTTSENAWPVTGTATNFRDSLQYAREFAQSARSMVGR